MSPTEFTFRFLVALVGATVVAWNLAWLWRMRRLLTAAERVVATVTRVDARHDRHRQPGVEVRYVALYQVGEDVFEAEVPKPYAVGSPVPVRYLPEAPSTYLAGWLLHRLFGPLFLSVWGVVVVYLAIASRTN
jgi:hypothetical protein